MVSCPCPFLFACSLSLDSANWKLRRFSGDEAFLPDQRDASQRDAGVELGVVVEGKKKATKL